MSKRKTKAPQILTPFELCCDFIDALNPPASAETERLLHAFADVIRAANLAAETPAATPAPVPSEISDAMAKHLDATFGAVATRLRDLHAALHNVRADLSVQRMQAADTWNDWRRVSKGLPLEDKVALAQARATAYMGQDRTAVFTPHPAGTDTASLDACDREGMLVLTPAPWTDEHVGELNVVYKRGAAWEEAFRNKCIATARRNYSGNIVNVDDDAKISQTDDGTWVQAWVWVDCVDGSEED